MCVCFLEAELAMILRDKLLTRGIKPMRAEDMIYFDFLGAELSLCAGSYASESQSNSSCGMH